MAKGGRREGAGRPKGAVNKATADIREAAQEYSAQALQVLVSVATEGESEAARVAAANAILDRAHGKPKQTIDAAVALDEGLAQKLQGARRRVGDSE